MSTNYGGGSTASTSVTRRTRVLSSMMLNWQRIIQRHFHETVEVQTVMYFLTVASSSQPSDITTIGTSLGLTKAASSRNSDKLGDGWKNVEGLGLIETFEDPNDRRRKLVQLTSKGQRVATELADNIFHAVGRIQNVSDDN